MRYHSVAGVVALLGGIEVALAQTTIPVYGQCGGTGWTGMSFENLQVLTCLMLSFPHRWHDMCGGIDLRV